MITPKQLETPIENIITTPKYLETPIENITPDK